MTIVFKICNFGKNEIVTYNNKATLKIKGVAP